MPLFFKYNKNLNIGDKFTIAGNEFWHIKVNRKNIKGKILNIKDNRQSVWQCCVISANKFNLNLEVICPIDFPNIKTSISLYVGLIKENNLKIILQKTTELGIDSLNIINCSFSNNFFKLHNLDNKIKRWKKIIIEACKQSGLLKTPKLRYFSTLIKALEEIENIHQNKILLDINGQPIKNINSDEDKKNWAVLIGPEGGFSPKEKKLIKYTPVSLGELTLRSETAAIAVTSYLMLN